MYSRSFSVTVTNTATTLTALATTAAVSPALSGSARKRIRVYNHNNAEPNGNTKTVFIGGGSGVVSSGDVKNNGVPLPVGAERVFEDTAPDGLYLIVAAGTAQVSISIENDRT